MKRLLFETEPCVRCAGSGWYSYCEMWGHTCFECGVRPHAQGTGRRFTKVAKLAMAEIDAFVKAHFSRRADAVEPGMWFLPYGKRPVRVIAVQNPGASGIVQPDGSVKWGLTLETKGCGHGYQPEHLVAVIPTEAEWDTRVVPFAMGLAGVSVEGQDAIGLYKLVIGKNGRRVEFVTRFGEVDSALAYIARNCTARSRRRMFIAPVQDDPGRAKSWAVAA